MRTSSELLLTFLLNAVWQIALIGALVSLGVWLLRRSAARYQHWLWVAALCLSFVVPVVTAVRTLPDSVTTPTEITYAHELTNPVSIREISTPSDQTLATTSNSAFELNNTFAVALLSVFAAFFLYRSFKLGQAWFSTRKVRRSAVQVEGDEAVAAIMRECAKRLKLDQIRVTVCQSATVAVPVTIGLLKPVIILPESLLHEDGNRT